VEPAVVGYLVGIFIGIILIPVLILIVCNFIPAAKRKPRAVYGGCGVLTVLLSVAVIKNSGVALVMSILGALFFFWGYKRAAKKIRNSATVGASHG
jgi:hypothetical protein